MNTYKKYLLEQLSSHLSQMESNDDRNHNNQNLIKSITVQDFFDFYLKEIKISPLEIVEATDRSSILVGILYSPWKDKYIQRKEWIESFKPALQENVSFFTKCLKECLSSHASVNDSKNETLKNARLKANLEIFQDLVKLGKSSGHFNTIAQSELNTSYSVYQNILKEEGLFKEDFNFNDFKSSLSEKKEKPYFHTLVNATIDFLNKNPEKILELTDKQLDMFVGQLVEVKDKTYKDAQEQFLKNFIIDNQSVRKKINLSHRQQMFDNFQGLIPLYFEKLLPSEKTEIYGLGYDFPHGEVVNGWGSKIDSWVGSGLSTSKGNYLEREKFIEFEVIDTFINGLKNYYMNSQESQFYAARMINHLVAYNIDLNEKRSLNRTTEILQYIEDNIHHFNIDFSQKGNYISKDIHPYKKVWDFLESQSSSKLSVLKENYSQNSLKILNRIFNSEYQTKNLDILDALIHNVNSDEILSNISNHYNWTQEFNVKIKSINSKGKDKYLEMPLLFAIFTKSNVPLFEKIIKEPNLSKICDVRYKGKGIIQYLSTTYKAAEYLDILSQNTQAFKTLVIDDKKTFKALSTHDNDNIKKATLYLKMGEVLEEKTSVVKKNKI